MKGIINEHHPRSSCHSTLHPRSTHLALADGPGPDRLGDRGLHHENLAPVPAETASLFLAQMGRYFPAGTGDPAPALAFAEPPACSAGRHVVLQPGSGPLWSCRFVPADDWHPPDGLVDEFGQRFPDGVVWRDPPARSGFQR